MGRKSDDRGARGVGAGEDTLVTACGPPGMIEDVVVPSLARLGHADARIMVF